MGWWHPGGDAHLHFDECIGIDTLWFCEKDTAWGAAGSKTAAEMRLM
jgi:hypothetical protein